MNCPNCDRRLPHDDAFFCPWCAKQARCLNETCGASLASEAVACMRCGTLVGGRVGAVTGASNDARARGQERHPNRISLTETPKSRSFEAELSDHAVDSLGDALAAFAVGKLMPGGSGRRTVGPNGMHAVDPRQLSLPESVVDGELTPSVTAQVVDLAVNLGGHGGLERLMVELDRHAHPEVKAAPRVLDHALHLLKIAKEGFALDGMTASELATALTDRFLIPTTPQAVRNAFARAGDKVHAAPGEDGVQRYRLMSAGEAYLADPESHQAAGGRRRGTTRPTRRPKSAASTPENAGADEATEEVTPPEKRSRTHAGRPGPMASINMLVGKGYFASGRMLGEILKHLEQQYALSYTKGDMSPSLTRSVRNGTLNRELRAADGQYEYRAP